MPNFCAAPNCTKKSTQSDLAFFRFPRDPERISEKPSGFKKCVACSHKLPNCDIHEKCIYCLGPSQLKTARSIWEAFGQQAVMERRNKLILKGFLPTPGVESAPSSSKRSSCDAPLEDVPCKRSCKRTHVDSPEGSLTEDTDYDEGEWSPWSPLDDVSFADILEILRQRGDWKSSISSSEESVFLQAFRARLSTFLVTPPADELIQLIVQHMEMSPDAIEPILRRPDKILSPPEDNPHWSKGLPVDAMIVSAGSLCFTVKNRCMCTISYAAKSPYRTVLRDSAVPTIFDLTSHLNNPRSRHRKRIKELSEEELQKLKVRRIEEDAEQEKVNRAATENSTESTTQDSGQDQEEEVATLTQEEKEHKDYLKSLFEILIMMGKQNIPLNSHGSEAVDGVFTPDNFQALLEYRINAGDEVLRKKFEMAAVNTQYCSSVQQQEMLDVCEYYIREEILREVRDSRFFSIVTDEVVEIADEEYLPVFIRFVDEANNLREEFIGFLPYEYDTETMAVKLQNTITEKWSLSMEYCRGQAYACSTRVAYNMKTVASRLLEKYPQAVCTLCSSCALNIWLAKSIPVPGVTVVLETMEELFIFFRQSALLQSELDNVITVLFQSSEEKVAELKEVYRTRWSERHDAFEILVELLQAMVMYLDEVCNDISFRWSKAITNQAFVLSQILTDFDFIVTVVVLKNTLSFTRAFGKNLQGQTSDVYFAAGSLTAVLHSLNEVIENVEVYHEFWFEEATDLATRLDIQVKLPGRYRRAQQGAVDSETTPECYYRAAVTVPTVTHIIQELKDIFSESYLKALKCLSLVPSVMGQLKFSTTEEENANMYKSDLPNPDTFSAELHCWRIKWKHRGKDVELPTTIYEAVHLPDIKFFPNVYALLKILCILPVIKVENQKYETGRQRLKAYLRNTPREQRSCSLALLNVNYDVKDDLDLMVDNYTKLCTEKTQFQQEIVHSSNSDLVEQT
ncbi:52 kDa repressor of the inhibitor of the protein kinase [Protopterus annectens]|uniref:52 kDa repressor of the inhibitor of the protein kinase n=1 Tax=Protopterus annectens TaxID=7888 RepID=UPI001CFC138B|nr:52 kDa repressor of the inhibitor of the protein kinase [Protopterus annectens]